jgi:hypothetical protein
MAARIPDNQNIGLMRGHFLLRHQDEIRAAIAEFMADTRTDARGSNTMPHLIVGQEHLECACKDLVGRYHALVREELGRRHGVDNDTPPPTGAAWTVVNVLALVAMVGFSIGVGVFKKLLVVGDARASVRHRRARGGRPVRHRAMQTRRRVRGPRRADQPVDAHPRQRGSNRDRAPADGSRLGHAASVTRPANSPTLRRHADLQPTNGAALVIDPAGRGR